MRGLLSNPFQRPAGQPSLNMRHPANAPKALRLAAIAWPSGGMKDLFTGFTSTNTTVGTEVNSLGVCVFPSANQATTSFLGFPSLIPSELLNNCTLGVIFQPRGFGVGQGLINVTSLSSPYKFQTGTTALLQFVASSVAQWSIPVIPGHNYFAAVSLNHAATSTANSVVANMTTGQIWQIPHGVIPSPTAGAFYSVLTYNFASGVNTGRVAAAMISANTLSVSQLLAWANDPWSLWYDTSPSALMFSAGRHAAIIPPPPTGGLLANPFSYVATASTNATSVATRPSALTGWDMINLSAATSYVRIYNKATAPVPASDAALIVARFPIPAGQRVQAQLGTNAGWLSKGLAFDITTAAPDTDATATAAGDVIVNLFFE